MFSEDFNFWVAMCFFASIFGMFFFAALKPSIRIARWFYLIFGVSIILLCPMLSELVESKLLLIWPLLFAATGIGVFFGATKSLKDIKGTKKEEELNKKFQEMSLKQGKRSILKNILKNKK